MNKFRKEVLEVGWGVSVGVGFLLNPYLGLALAIGVLTFYTRQFTNEQQTILFGEELLTLELAVQTAQNQHNEKLDRLVEQFTLIRTDEAVRRGQAHQVPRLRG